MTALLKRRFVLAGLLAAPMVIRTAGLLMPVRPLELIEPKRTFYVKLHSASASPDASFHVEHAREALTFTPPALVSIYDVTGDLVFRNLPGTLTYRGILPADVQFV
jgi:hypothetical protein